MKRLTTMLMVAALVPGVAWGQDDERRALRRTPVVDVFESNRDAVVNISATEVVRMRDRFGGLDSIFEDIFDMPRSGREREFTRTSAGSGFVIHPDGYIVTNAHVLANTEEVRVGFADGSDYEARIVALDSRRDVAMLKIDAPSSLQTVKMGRSDDLMIGETVVAIGNPLGYQHTVTAGVVSATNRDLEFSQEMVLRGLIQTDASINLGNSGGPLLNVLGELIGVNTAIRGDAQNIGFAIPVDQLRHVLPALLDVERRYRFTTGVEIDATGAPRIVRVEPGSPAADAGLRPGDVVESIDGRRVAEPVDFHIALIGRQPGDRLGIAVDRSGRRHRADLRLAKRAAPDGARLAADRLGIAVQPISEPMAERLRVRRDSGLVVADVEARGPGAELGIQAGDVLQQVGGRSVTTVEELGQVLDFVEGGEAVEVAVLRRERGRLWRLFGTIASR